MKGKTIYIVNGFQPSVRDIEQHNINNLSLLSNGSVDTIICDCLDSVAFSDRIKHMTEIFSKLKVNGTAIFKTINLKIFAKHILTDKIDTAGANNILGSIKSMLDDSDIDNILSNYTNIRMVESINDGLSKTLTLQRVSL
jgi:hypothetical protein